MQKVLVTIAFALAIEDEADIGLFAQSMDDNLRRTIADLYTPENAAVMQQGEQENLIDWYGATIAIRRSVFEEVGI